MAATGAGTEAGVDAVGVRGAGIGGQAGHLPPPPPCGLKRMALHSLSSLISWHSFWHRSYRRSSSSADKSRSDAPLAAIPISSLYSFICTLAHISADHLFFFVCEATTK